MPNCDAARRRGGLDSFLILSALFFAAVPTPTLAQAGCTKGDLAKWNAVKSLTVGAIAVDPVNTDSRAGEFVAKRFGVKNWVPLSDRKEVMCGRVDHFKWFNEGKEHDWNIFMIPSVDAIGASGSTTTCDAVSSSFCGTFENAKKYGNPDSVWSCAGGTHNCFEAEVTPPSSFYENPWFSKIRETSALVGHDVCTFGPMVVEAVHGFRPEIHPLELLWWKEPEDREHWILMQLQDRSDRFAKTDNFWRVGSVEPSDWEPWSRLPKTGEFRIPVELPLAADSSLSSSPINFDVTLDPKYSANVKPSEVRASTTHTFTYKNKTAIEVTEKQGVSFANVVFDICKDDSIPRLIGFVKIRTTLGLDERQDKQSFAVFHFVRTSATVPLLPPSTILTPTQAATVLASIPKQGSIETITTSPDRGDVVDVSYTKAKENKSRSVELFAQFAGLDPKESDRLSHSTIFAPATFTTAKLSSGLSTEVRPKSLVKPTAKHNARPFEGWAFTAFDCGDHKKMKTGCANAKPLTLWIQNSKWDTYCNQNKFAVCVYRDPSAPNVAHTSIHFPEALEDHLIRVVASGKECDIRNKECEKEELEFWNQGFRLKNTGPEGVEQFLVERAADFGLPASVVEIPEADPDSPLLTETNSRYREAQALRLYVTHVAEDGVLDPNQFSNVLAAIRRLAAASSP